jgi:hypothetical protein
VGVAFAAHGTLPGDSLYPVKLSLEDTQLWLADEPARVELATQFAQRRIEEMQTLIEASRERDLPIAAQNFSTRIEYATNTLTAIIAQDPERAAQLSLALEATLTQHQQMLTERLQIVPDPAKPAIQRAIEASSRGQQALEDLFGDSKHPGPPAEKPETPPAGGPPDKRPEVPSGPPGWAPGGRP